ncbi:MAG: hypothetical protein KC464_31065 [Myxococcales bacterium]|nr:hypothetical protein [Myxococcales bacterium]
MEDDPVPSRGQDGWTERLSTAELAELIVDALRVAGIVAPADVARALTIVAEEVHARKCVGDY